MHIVYLFKFKREQLPNLYIGSKSNCSIVNGKIIDKRGNIYQGSCKSDLYLSALSDCKYDVFILGKFDVYDNALLMERDSHIVNDVVASPNYFNRSIATINSYTNPEYATYKNLLSEKIARLPRLHPEVLNGNWVGVTKGVIFTEEERLSRGRSEEENGFYNKHHTEETLTILSDKAITRGREPWKKRSAESKQKYLDAVSKPKSEDHKKKIGRRGLIMLQNIETLEYIRIPKEDVPSYDSNIWMNGTIVRKKLKLLNNGV